MSAKRGGELDPHRIESHLIRLIAILFVVVLLSIPMCESVFAPRGAVELSWLLFGSVAALAAAVLLMVLEPVSTRVSWLSRRPLPAVVKYLALSALVLVFLWSMVKND